MDFSLCMALQLIAGTYVYRQVLYFDRHIRRVVDGYIQSQWNDKRLINKVQLLCASARRGISVNDQTYAFRGVDRRVTD